MNRETKGTSMGRLDMMTKAHQSGPKPYLVMQCLIVLAVILNKDKDIHHARRAGDLAIHIAYGQK
jgi:hypothetical protein